MAERKTIVEEHAEVLTNVLHEGDQFIMRLHAPRIAAAAQPGQFVHVRVSDERPMRRPISIMLADPEKGTLDLLVKAVGEGTRLLRRRKSGERLSLLGPIGRAFDLSDHAKRYVLIGGGVGIPPMIFAAVRLQGKAESVLFAGSEVRFPFALRPSTLLMPGVADQVLLTIASLEERGIPCRLASNAGLYGCYQGHVTDLAGEYLAALNEDKRRRCVLLACGPHPMLHAVAGLGRRFAIPAFLSLEEYMACGVGGCAGCVVKTIEDGRERYRRVCVDGPVFPAEILPCFA